MLYLSLDSHKELYTLIQSGSAFKCIIVFYTIEWTSLKFIECFDLCFVLLGFVNTFISSLNKLMVFFDKNVSIVLAFYKLTELL